MVAKENENETRDTAAGILLNTRSTPRNRIILLHPGILKIICILNEREGEEIITISLGVAITLLSSYTLILYFVLVRAYILTSRQQLRDSKQFSIWPPSPKSPIRNGYNTITFSC